MERAITPKAGPTYPAISRPGIVGDVATGIA
jgi:hypothetical protein